MISERGNFINIEPFRPYLSANGVSELLTYIVHFQYFNSKKVHFWFDFSAGISYLVLIN